ncbi:MAG: TrbG/VirB9 family P-type conjugative transfer protein, partial [Polyangiaceae bacterium]
MKPVPPPPARSTWGLLAQAAATTEQIVAEANRQASQGPARDTYFNAIAQYSYEPGTLYQVYASPMRITDIALEPGEKIIGEPASGDVVRWILALGKSMQSGVEQWHVYLKPTRPDLSTNLAINTDRRSYLLELHSYESTFMAAIVWHYPEDELARLQAQAAELAGQQRSASPVVGVDALNFVYAIQVVKGKPVWTPVQVFDDG